MVATRCVKRSGFPTYNLAQRAISESLSHSVSLSWARRRSKRSGALVAAVSDDGSGVAAEDVMAVVGIVCDAGRLTVAGGDSFWGEVEQALSNRPSGNKPNSPNSLYRNRSAWCNERAIKNSLYAESWCAQITSNAFEGSSTVVKMEKPACVSDELGRFMIALAVFWPLF